MYINPCTTTRTAKIFPWYPASETDAKPVRRSRRVEVLIRADTTPAQVDFKTQRDLQTYTETYRVTERLTLTVRFTERFTDLQKGKLQT